MAALAVLGTAAAAVVVLAPLQAQVAQADEAGLGGDYVPLSAPVRVLDTRSGVGGDPAPLGSGATVTFPVAGRGEIPPTGVKAVLLDVTSVNGTATTHLDLWPQGESKPQVSMLSAPAGQVISNSAVVAVGAGGGITVSNFAGTTNVVVDVHGYFTTSPAENTGGGGYHPGLHTRVVDTRSGLGAPKASIPADGSVTVQVTPGGLAAPAPVAAVFLNVLVPDAPGTSGGYLSAFPPGSPNSASIVDFMPGQTASGAVVRVDQLGRATFVNHSGGAVNLVLDAEGYFLSDSSVGAGLRVRSTRLFDSRGFAGPLQPNQTIDVAVAGAQGLPTAGVAGAVLNLTSISRGPSGFLRAWGTSDPEPTTSLGNFTSAGERAENVVVRPGADGAIRIRNVSGGLVDVVVDLQGWFGDPVPQLPVEPHSPVMALQASPVQGASTGTVEYALVDDDGRLWSGQQPSPTDFTTINWAQVPADEPYTGQPALAEQGDGLLQVMAHDTHGGVAVRTRPGKPSPEFGPPTSLGGTMRSTVSVGRDAAGRLNYYAIDHQGILWCLSQSAGTGPFLPWAKVTANRHLSGRPVIVGGGEGRTRIFVLDETGAVLTGIVSCGAGDPVWENLGGSGITDPPAVATLPGPHYQVFVRAADGTILTKGQEASGSFQAEWQQLGSFVAAGPPAALLSPLDGLLEVVVRGTDGAIYSTGEVQQASREWRDWVRVTPEGQAAPATDPTVLMFRDLFRDRWGFVVGNTGGGLDIYTQRFEDNSPVFDAWHAPGPPIG